MSDCGDLYGSSVKYENEMASPIIPGSSDSCLESFSCDKLDSEKVISTFIPPPIGTTDVEFGILSYHHMKLVLRQLNLDPLRKRDVPVLNNNDET